MKILVTGSAGDAEIQLVLTAKGLADRGYKAIEKN
jgi:hypothetical protein